MTHTHYPYKKIALIALSNDIALEPIQHIFEKHAQIDKILLYDKQHFAHMNVAEHSDATCLFLTAKGTRGLAKMAWEQADYIYVIISENVCPIPIDLVAALKGRPCDIVIVHETLGPYKNTLQYYDHYAFKRHHHITATPVDYQRIYRFMTGQAIGLVISGGGFRGYAHYGLVKALFEAKVPIDSIGGSSMGATMGALLSINFTWSGFDEQFHFALKKMKTRAWKHLTVPQISFLSGWAVTHMIQALFGAYQIEDLPLNFFCVTGNLSRGEKELKTRGSLWEWLRASVAIPGILPPFEKNGMIYVDGGVCTNLPVLDMREYLDGAGKIITFDIRIPPFHQKHYSFPPILTIKDYIWQKLRLAKQRYVFPALLDVIMESSLINQHMYDNQGAKKADIIISPDATGLSFHDMIKSASLLLIAHELAQDRFRETKALYERWIIE